MGTKAASMLTDSIRRTLAQVDTQLIAGFDGDPSVDEAVAQLSATTPAIVVARSFLTKHESGSSSMME